MGLYLRQIIPRLAVYLLTDLVKLFNRFSLYKLKLHQHVLHSTVLLFCWGIPFSEMLTPLFLLI